MTDVSSTDGWQLQVDRYIAGECTSAEAMAVRGWMAADASRRALVEELVRRYRAGAPAVVPPLDDRAVAQAFDLVERRIARTTQGVDTFPGPRPQGVGVGEAGWGKKGRAGQRPAPTTAMAIAAMVVVALGVGLAVGASRHGAVVASPGRAYATAAGQRLSVTLVDGTHLTLAPASTVRIAAGYGRGTSGREVDLEGEAYFAVTHDAAHPFAVRAHGAVARDVGTAFGVRAYPEDGTVQVVVAEGAVELHATQALTAASAPAAHPVLLTARTVGIVDPSGNTRVVTGVDVTPSLAWRDGELVFDDTPVRDVLRELERWYGVEIRLGDDALGARHVRATIHAQSLTEALDLLVPSAGARYERHGATITIYPAPDGVPVRTRSKP